MQQIIQVNLYKLTDMPLDVCDIEMFLEEGSDDGADDRHLPAGHTVIMQQDQKFAHHVESVHDFSILLTPTRNKLTIMNMYPLQKALAWIKTGSEYTSLYAAN